MFFFVRFVTFASSRWPAAGGAGRDSQGEVDGLPGRKSV